MSLIPYWGTGLLEGPLHYFLLLPPPRAHSLGKAGHAWRMAEEHQLYLPMELANTLFVWKIHRVYSFLDYIMGGCQIHFTVSRNTIGNGWKLLGVQQFRCQGSVGKTTESSTSHQLILARWA